MRFRFLILASVILIALPGYGQVAGKWTANVPGPQGEQEMTFDFAVDGDSVKGTVNSEFAGEAEIQAGEVEGDKISFKHAVELGQRTITLAYTGTIKEGEIELTRTLEGRGGRGGAGRGGRGGRGGGGGGRGRRGGLGGEATFTLTPAG
jgi:hypothetical protein